MDKVTWLISLLIYILIFGLHRKHKVSLKIIWKHLLAKRAPEPADCVCGQSRRRSSLAGDLGLAATQTKIRFISWKQTGKYSLRPENTNQQLLKLMFWRIFLKYSVQLENSDCKKREPKNIDPEYKCEAEPRFGKDSIFCCGKRPQNVRSWNCEWALK